MIFRVSIAPVLEIFSARMASGACREATLKDLFTAPRGKLNNSNEKQHCFGEQRTPYRFHFADTIGTQAHFSIPAPLAGIGFCPKEMEGHTGFLPDDPAIIPIIHHAVL